MGWRCSGRGVEIRFWERTDREGNADVEVDVDEEEAASGGAAGDCGRTGGVYDEEATVS